MRYQKERVTHVSTSALVMPLAYHRDVVAYLKTAEPELWTWASSAAVREEFAATVRMELLKSSYRLDAEAHPELAGRACTVAQKLGITAPVTLYQATGTSAMNAFLCYLPGEVHVVFSGPLLATLQGPELDAVLGHELAHYRLWEMEGGDFLVADQLLAAAANDPRAAGSHAHTARRFRLYTEVFADRGALAACAELEPAVAALVKVETGLATVSAASYLRQAEEIFARETAETRGVEHPELFVRARALKLWASNEAELEKWLSRVIEGTMGVDSLDLSGQQRMVQLTRRFLGELLRPAWFRTAQTLAHARAFFPDFAVPPDPDATLMDELRSADSSMHEYLAYLLLDFVPVDKGLEDVPLAAALQWSERLEMTEVFEKLVVKELGVTRKQLARCKKEAAAICAKAEAAS